MAKKIFIIFIILILLLLSIYSVLSINQYYEIKNYLEQKYNENFKIQYGPMTYLFFTTDNLLELNKVKVQSLEEDITFFVFGCKSSTHDRFHDSFEYEKYRKELYDNINEVLSAKSDAIRKLSITTPYDRDSDYHRIVAPINLGPNEYKISTLTIALNENDKNDYIDILFGIHSLLNDAYMNKSYIRGNKVYYSLMVDDMTKRICLEFGDEKNLYKNILEQIDHTQ